MAIKKTKAMGQNVKKTLPNYVPGTVLKKELPNYNPSTPMTKTPAPMKTLPTATALPTRKTPVQPSRIDQSQSLSKTSLPTKNVPSLPTRKIPTQPRVERIDQSQKASIQSTRASQVQAAFSQVSDARKAAKLTKSALRKRKVKGI